MLGWDEFHQFVFCFSGERVLPVRVVQQEQAKVGRVDGGVGRQVLQGKRLISSLHCGVKCKELGSIHELSHTSHQTQNTENAAVSLEIQLTVFYLSMILV